MANGLLWWRVETDADGKTVKCELAVAREHDTGLVFFVRARDTRHAGRLAFNAYMLAVTKARHAQYAREGRCKCGRDRDVAGKKMCSGCLARNAEYKKRNARRAAGETIPHQSRLEVIEQRRADDRDALRLAVLEEVRGWWKESNNVWRFVARLKLEIEKLSPKRDANIRRSA